MVEGRNRAAIDESTEGQPREGMGDTKTPLHRRRWWLTGKVSRYQGTIITLIWHISRRLHSAQSGYEQDLSTLLTN
jgi:hypothetical protein